MFSTVGLKRIILYIAAAAAFFLCAGMTGCGSGSENTDAGMLAVSDGDYDGALALFSQARDAGEEERLILRGEGIAHMGQLDYQAAIESFSEALKLNHVLPSDIDYDMNYYLACCYLKNDEPDKAVSVYNAIISLNGSDADAYYERGMVELAQGNADAAAADFNKSLSIGETDYNRGINMYEALADEGFIEAGESVLQGMLDRGQKSITDYDLGRIYYCMGNYDQARESLERAMKKDRNADTVLALGRVYMGNKDYAYAVSLFESYLKDDQECVAVWNELGLCELQRDNPEAALSAFQSGVASEGSGDMRQVLMFNEICAYERLGDFTAARERAAEYTGLYPDDEDGAREYAFLSTR